MERFLAFVKEHPMITGGTALAVLLVIFWPRSAAKSGTSDQATLAAAQANEQVANSTYQTAALQAQTATAINKNNNEAAIAIASDQLSAVGLQTATANSINTSNNAAAMHIADTQATVQQAQIGAQLSGLQSTLASNEQHDRTSLLQSAFGALASILPTTQANANKAGNLTDAAGFTLSQQFSNLINMFGGTAVTTNVIQDRADPVLTTFLGSHSSPTNITDITPANMHGVGFSGQSIDLAGGTTFFGGGPASAPAAAPAAPALAFNANPWAGGGNR